MSRMRVAGVIFGLALVAAGCGTGPEAHRNSAKGVYIMSGDGADRLPTDTAADWVSYADHVVVFRVVADAEVPPGPSEDNITKAGEGYIGRTVDVTIDKTVWSRPGAPAIPTSLQLRASGWHLKNGVKQEVAVPGDSRMEVGHTYITALARYADGNWDALGGGTILPIDDGIIGHGELKGGWPAKPDAVVAAVKNKTTAAVAALLTSTAPNATAARYASLDPVARYHKVLAAQNHQPGLVPRQILRAWHSVV